MKTVILAGGFGTRLKSTVSDIPKPMVEVMGKPFLEWQIKLLRKYNLRNIVLSIGYLGDKIKDYFQDGRKLGVNIEYSEEDKPLGTGGGLKNAKTYVDDEEDFLVMNGDSYLDLDFSQFIAFHKKKTLTTMALTRIDRPSKCGCVRLDEDSRIISFIETEKSIGIINAGVQAFSYEVFRYMPPRRKFSLECDLFPSLIKSKRVFGYLTEGYFRDIGTLEGYNAIKKELREIV